MPYKVLALFLIQRWEFFLHRMLYQKAILNTRTKLLVLGLLGLMITACQQQASESANGSKTKIPAPELRRMSYELYGLDVKSKQVLQGTLDENQFMQDLLKEHHVEPSKIDAIEKKSAEIFDVRRMRAGNTFTLVKNAYDQVDYFIYEKNPAQFVVYDFRDTLAVYEGKEDAIYRNKTIGGHIDLTLFNTIQDMELDVRIAKLLEEIYAWTIDFAHLDAKDYFKVIYEEAYVDGSSIGITQILASVMHHDGKDYYAFYFPQDTLQSYYDEDGQSVKRTFLKSPLRYIAASANEENLPSQKDEFSLEYVGSKGTPILSLGKGDISIISRNRQKGTYIRVNHGEIYSTEYQNLGSVIDSLEVGQDVQQGEAIGYIGSNLSAQKGSFSLQFLKNERPTPSESFELSTQTDSISATSRKEYEERVRLLRKELDKKDL